MHDPLLQAIEAFDPSEWVFDRQTAHHAHGSLQISWYADRTHVIAKPTGSVAFVEMATFFSSQELSPKAAFEVMRSRLHLDHAERVRQKVIRCLILAGFEGRWTVSIAYPRVSLQQQTQMLSHHQVEAILGPALIDLVLTLSVNFIPQDGPLLCLNKMSVSLPLSRHERLQILQAF